MADRTGEQLDRYHLLRLLGEGNSGEVYLAEQVHVRRQVALKVLNMQYSQDFLEHFLREARTLFLLKHPQIVALLDFGMVGKTPFLAMEYAPGGTLGQRHQKGEQISLETVNSYVQQAAQALQYAHDQRLIHRDIKPQNLLLGEQGQLLLGDFGVAAIAHSEQSLATQAAVGTVAYMAPEQIEGKPRPASDQYSLGVCVYEWLCGTRPFLGSTMEIVTQHLASAPDPLRRHAPALPGAVEAVVLRALAKDPQQRFPSIAAFAQAFAQAPRQTNQPQPSASWFGAATFADSPPARPVLTATLPDLPEEATLVPAVQAPPAAAGTPQSASQLSERSVAPAPKPVAHVPPPVPIPSAPPPASYSRPPAPRPVVAPPTHQLSASAQLAPVPAQAALAGPKRRGPKILLLLLALLLVLGGAGGGYAYYLATRPAPVITVTSAYHDQKLPAGAATTTLLLRGSAFTAHSAIALLLDGVIFTPAPFITSDSHGGISSSLLITSAWPIGVHTLTARDGSGYSTQAGVKIKIVAPGQAGTPGPNGAPTDGASMSIDASVTTGSGSIPWFLVVNKGSVCSPQRDDGQPQTLTGTTGGIAYTRTLTRTCSGTYRGGALDYQETTSSDSYAFANGLICNARTPYISIHLQGNFTSGVTISGSYDAARIIYDCNPGAVSQTVQEDTGTWIGTATLTA